MSESGQRCSYPACASKGEPDREIPCAAWCAEHAAVKLAERVAVFQEAVRKREERERAGQD